LGGPDCRSGLPVLGSGMCVGWVGCLCWGQLCVWVGCEWGVFVWAGLTAAVGCLCWGQVCVWGVFVWAGLTTSAFHRCRAMCQVCVSLVLGVCWACAGLVLGLRRLDPSSVAKKKETRAAPQRQ
jgi:hypothetical protein